MKCDLHIHSTLSDGKFTPEQIVDMAHERGLDCVSVTDHDTFDGTKRAKKRAEELGVKYITGAELSTLQNGLSVHILAYNVNIDDPELTEVMAKIASLRHERNKAMFAKLAEHGINLDLDALAAKDGSLGRPAIAEEMVRLGYCKDVPDAFERYIGDGKVCYVQTERLTPTEAIRLTLHFGGIPVLAHPKLLHMDKHGFEEFLKPLVAVGLSGIESHYFAHNINERNFFHRLAKKYKLISTGGSDFHDYVHGMDLGAKSFSPSGYTRRILGI